MVTTIVLPVSRDDYLKQIFTNLEFLDCDKENTNLLVYVDGDFRLYEKARNLTANSKFQGRLCIYRKKGLSNATSIRRRRQRIADIHNEIKTHISSCDYVFLLEDDTLIPKDTLSKMLRIYSQNPFAGFVSGVELGRWGYLHVGAWIVDNVYEPTKIISVGSDDIQEQETIPVDAAGLYCCLTRRDNYIDTMFHPFENVLGPDVYWGISLRKMGYLNYIDTSIRCTHLTKKEKIEVQGADIIQIEFNSDNQSRTGWSHKVIQNLLV